MATLTTEPLRAERDVKKGVFIQVATIAGDSVEAGAQQLETWQSAVEAPVSH